MLVTRGNVWAVRWYKKVAVSGGSTVLPVYKLHHFLCTTTISLHMLREFNPQ